MMEVDLTETGKTWIQEHHPQGIVWEYDPDKPFKLHNMGAEFVELKSRGIPYWIPLDVEGQPTVKKATTGGKSSVF